MRRTPGSIWKRERDDARYSRPVLANVSRYYYFNFLSVWISNTCMSYKIQKLPMCIKNETSLSFLCLPATQSFPRGNQWYQLLMFLFRDSLYYTHIMDICFSFCHNSILYTVLRFLFNLRYPGDSSLPIHKIHPHSFVWLYNIPLEGRDHSFFAQSHIDRHAGCFHCSLNLLNGATVFKDLGTEPHISQYVCQRIRGASLIKTHSTSWSPWLSSLQLLLNYPNLSFQIDVFS